MGITSLILGIVSIVVLFLCGGVFSIFISIAGIITGIIGITKKEKYSVIGIILSSISIVIFGILIAIAIPTASNSIDNARKDTFVSVAGEYVTTVRKAILNDSIECSETPSESATDFKKVSQLGDGDYYFFITTKSNVLQTNNNGFPSELAIQAEHQAIDLVENNTKSPWGATNIYGWIHWTKENNTISTYYIALTDELGHGVADEKKTSELHSSAVLSKDAKADAMKIYNAINNNSQSYYCHQK